MLQEVMMVAILAFVIDVLKVVMGTVLLVVVVIALLVKMKGNIGD